MGVALLLAITEADIVVLFLWSPRPRAPGLSLVLVTLSICVLALAIGAFRGYRVVDRLQSSLRVEGKEATLFSTLRLYLFAMAMVGSLAIIVSLALVTDLLARFRGIK